MRLLTDVSSQNTSPDKSSAKIYSTIENRKRYLRKYYQEHREKILEYQRMYSLRKRKGPRKFSAEREIIRTTFNPRDIMKATTEKSLRMFEQILSGERYFTK